MASGHAVGTIPVSRGVSLVQQRAQRLHTSAQAAITTKWFPGLSNLKKLWGFDRSPVQETSVVTGQTKESKSTLRETVPRNTSARVKKSKPALKKMRLTREAIPIFAPIRFSQSTLVQNNLGGQGPGDAVMLFKSASHYNGKPVDIRIEAIGTYTGNATKNGLYGDFIHINVAPDTSVELLVSILDEDGLPVSAPAVSMSFWDMDSAADDTGVESVVVNPISSFFVSEDTQVVAAEVNATSYVFAGSQEHSKADDPDDIFSASALQRSRAVEVEVREASQFTVKLSASAAAQGRTFLLAGATRLKFNGERTDVGMCEDHITMALGDFVGGELGPGKSGLRFAGVTSLRGKKVDLIVTSDDRYNASNASNNGLLGDMMIINLATNTTSNLTFTFVNAATNEKIEVPKLLIQILDIDHNRGGREIVTVPKRQGMFHWIMPNSSVELSETEGHVTFASTMEGTIADNPKSSAMIGPMQWAKTALVLLSEPLTDFSLELQAIKAHTGRNFELSFFADNLCEKPEPEEGDPCKGGGMDLSFDAEKVINNNLGGETDGAGPAEIRIADVARVGGDSVDLVMQVDESYRSNNASQNMVIGNMVQINIADGVKTDLTLTFVNSSSNEPIELKKFVISVLDLDGTKIGYEQVSIKTDSFKTYMRDLNSSVLVKTKADTTIFRSTKFGSDENNPDGIPALNQEQLSESFGVCVVDATSQVTLTLEGVNTWTGRNFFISGTSEQLYD